MDSANPLAVTRDADSLARRFARPLTIGLGTVFLLGLALSIWQGEPSEPPGIAFGWPLLLHIERAVALVALAALLALFFLRAWTGDFPRRFSTAGAEWPDVTQAVIGDLTRQIVDVEKQSKEAVDELRAAVGEVLERLPETAAAVDSKRSIDREFRDWNLALSELSDKAKAVEQINRLPEREKIVYTLRHYEGMSLEEIAQMLGMSRGSVARLDARARDWIEESTSKN